MSLSSGCNGLRLSAVAAALALAAPAVQADELLWIDHLGLQAGDPSVSVSFNAVSSGVGGGLSGLIVESSTTGEDAEGGGNKVVETAVPVPPGYLVDGVRVCYEYSSATSHISQIRLAQVQDPPDTALVLLDDGTDQLDPGPVCVDSAAPFAEAIDPAPGALLLSLRVNFGDVADRIVVRGVALHLTADPDSLLLEHTHEYLTGKGNGHNNTVAATTGPLAPLDDEEGDAPADE